jgi:GntR family transcriptional regulator, transcriptional repressor for pyruvate dehydrogenase complex
LTAAAEAATTVGVSFARPVQTVRTFEASIEHIIAGIERAHLRPGDRLPNESELARQLGISKPTLRQALRVLERSGLLKVKPGKAGGIFLESEYLPMEEISRHIATEEHSVLETLRARRLIESQIAHEAMQMATPEDLREIERTVDLLKRADITREQILRGDLMFHRVVARATHNRVLEDALKVVYRHLAPIRDLLSETEEDALETHAIHRAQLDAMRAHDSAALEEVLDVHYHFLEDRLAASLGHTWAELFGAPR